MSGERPRNLLVCLVGGTPQIVTETVYALATKKDPVVPDELILITTRFGKEKITKSLAGDGHWERLARKLRKRLPEISGESFQIPTDCRGNELEDIRTSNQNQITAEFIFSLIRRLARKKNTSLHCSIAGGRKTMSFYLASALQFFGRHNDHLYHVLVPSDFENRPDFFFPGDSGRNSKKPRIDLAELPFLRLKEIVNKNHETVEALFRFGQNVLDRKIKTSFLSICMGGRFLQLGNSRVSLPPLEMAVYLAFVDLKFESGHGLEKECGSCPGCFQSLAEITREPFFEKVLTRYRLILPDRDLDRSVLWRNWSKSLETQYPRQNISKINRRLNDGLSNEPDFLRFRITSRRLYGATVYGIPASPGSFKFADE